MLSIVVAPFYLPTSVCGPGAMFCLTWNSYCQELCLPSGRRVVRSPGHEPMSERQHSGISSELEAVRGEAEQEWESLDPVVNGRPQEEPPSGTWAWMLNDAFCN